MSYVGNDTGGTDAERVSEAQRLVSIIEANVDELTPREREFVMKMDGALTCSPKQLFWLRDIKDKYL